MKYRALFLDFYGTLVAEDDAIISAICSRVTNSKEDAQIQFAEYWSKTFSELCLNSFAGTFQSQREIELLSLSSAMSEYDVSGDPEQASAELFEYWRRPLAFADSAGFLSSCPLPICIVSNIDTEDILSAAGSHGWSFTNLITSEISKAYKPRPEIFRDALALMSVDAASVLHVGDSISSDIRGAAAAGIDTAWINRQGRNLPENLPGPTFEVRDLYELSFLLNRTAEPYPRTDEKGIVKK